VGSWATEAAPRGRSIASARLFGSTDSFPMQDAPRRHRFARSRWRPLVLQAVEATGEGVCPAGSIVQQSGQTPNLHRRAQRVSRLA
jgi:hypothetical protein